MREGERMTISPKKKRVINKVAGKLRKASQAHASQAKQIDNMIKNNKNVASGLKKKTSPALKKLSAS